MHILLPTKNLHLFSYLFKLLLSKLIQFPATGPNLFSKIVQTKPILVSISFAYLKTEFCSSLKCQTYFWWGIMCRRYRTLAHIFKMHVKKKYAEHLWNTFTFPNVLKYKCRNISVDPLEIHSPPIMGWQHPTFNVECGQSCPFSFFKLIRPSYCSSPHHKKNTNSVVPR